MHTARGRSDATASPAWTRRASRRLVAASLLLAGTSMLVSSCSRSDSTAAAGEPATQSTATTSTAAAALPTAAPAPPSSSTSSTAPNDAADTTTSLEVGEANVFPVQPTERASYARSHHTYPAVDIFAPCGSEVVAPATGTVQEVSLVDDWSAAVDDPATRGGLSFSVVGDDGLRYYGSHLGELDESVRPGSRVGAGQRIGTVGDSGNAAGTGCHLHFGLSTPCGPGDVLRRRGEFWPQEFLDAWRDGRQLSPASLADPSSC